MGYTHGEQWDDEKICNAIREVVSAKNLDRMPSFSELRNYFQSSAITCAISRNGGVKKFSSLVMLPIKESETSFGNLCEDLSVAQIEDMTGLTAVRMTTRYPYDVLVNGKVKVDVKSGHLFATPNNRRFYSFNLEKRDQTCDVFVCYCISKENEIKKTYIIPSCAVSGKTQLSIGEIKSVYDVYLDDWGIISEYNDFMQSTIKWDKIAE
jgi:hypothetical protein